MSTGVLTSCDFNKDSEPFCNFTQDTTDNNDWIRQQGPTPTPECDNMSNGQKIRLLSTTLSTSASQICVQFHYFMYGSDNTNVLRVLSKTGGEELEVWKKTGIQSPSWLKASITIILQGTNQNIFPIKTFLINSKTEK
uniref:MAM domain-containing protein n=1 Tax=Gouania willdenowi TaxID=441366 RepID=A0A8C5DZ75_GOUWI